MRYYYCPICGQKLIDKYIDCEGNVPYCSVCDKLHFPHNESCVIILVEYNDKILLIQQNYISQNYVCVAGHIKEKSDAEQTVVEEVFEEVGLNVKSLRFVNSYYYEKGDKLMLGYFVKASGVIKTNDEVDKYILVDKSEVSELLKDASIAIKLFYDCEKQNLI